VSEHTRAFLGLFLSKRKHITTVATPVGTHIREIVPTMRDTMINFGLIWIGFGIRLSDTFCDDLPVALLVACKLAIGALHTSSILEQFTTQRAAHNVVKLLLNELVAILLMHFLLLLADGTLTTEAEIETLLVLILFYCSTLVLLVLNLRK
jgi:hypothetical protein